MGKLEDTCHAASGKMACGIQYISSKLVLLYFISWQSLVPDIGLPTNSPFYNLRRGFSHVVGPLLRRSIAVPF